MVEDKKTKQEQGVNTFTAEMSGNADPEKKSEANASTECFAPPTRGGAGVPLAEPIKTRGRRVYPRQLLWDCFRRRQQQAHATCVGRAVSLQLAIASAVLAALALSATWVAVNSHASSGARVIKYQRGPAVTAQRITQSNRLMRSLMLRS